MTSISSFNSEIFPDISREPNEISLLAGSSSRPEAIPKNAPGCWEGKGVKIELKKIEGKTTVLIEAPQVELKRVWIKWKHSFKSETLFLGDAWERSYGDLEWRGFAIGRPTAWYFLATRQNLTAGYGVETGCSSVVSWEIGGDGVSLHLDVRCGGEGVRLGPRVLAAATIVQRPPQKGETPFQAACALCKALCPNPRLPSEPVVGHNDWYWLYGKNSEQLILEATNNLLDLWPKNTKVRPWSVIDDGWQEFGEGALANCNGGPWDRSNRNFPDMKDVASKIKKLGARPGVWMRPLLTKTQLPENLRIRCPQTNPFEAGFTMDPSIPEVLELVKRDISTLRGWGYELIKHDFSTYDVTGRWGPQLLHAHDNFAPDGWAYADRSKTSAEIILGLYRAIREAAGDHVAIIGCNTMSHLSAGIFEIQRTGDDTSAKDWDRTRRMGVNTLAFRAPQQGSFYAVDADCVPISPHISPRLTHAWLDLVARSGTPLFLSMDPEACSDDVKRQIRSALAYAVQECPVGEPLDWLETPFPSKWILQGDSASSFTSYHFQP